LIFNLALESGCEILERHSHSIDAYGVRRYLPLGRDATVAWASKDLVFRNSTGVSIRICVRAEATRAVGSVEGAAPMPFAVSISRNDFEAQKRSATSERIVQAIVTRELSAGTSNKLPAGKFLSEYRMRGDHPSN
jgi:vancomycin resistance protein YoaR